MVPVAVTGAEFSQFLSDVMTAAGLVENGMQCKALGERLTDRQIQEIWCSARNEGNQTGPFWFAHAIERAHGIT